MTSSAWVTPLMLGDLAGDGGRLADLGLDQDVGLDNHRRALLRRVGGRVRRRGDARERTYRIDATTRRERAHDRRRPATVGELGEVGLIAAVTARLGDDAGRCCSGPATTPRCSPRRTRRVVATTDLLVEGRHFRRDWSERGRRRAHGGGGQPRRHRGDGRGADRAAGRAGGARRPAGRSGCSSWPTASREEAARAGAAVAGGDLVRGDAVTIAVTALGTLEGREPVTRAGARPGDLVAVAGRLGWAAAGLAVLSRGFRSPRALVDAHRRPAPPYDEGPAGRRARRHRDGRRQRRPGRRPRAPGRGQRRRRCGSTRTRSTCRTEFRDTARALNADPLQWLLAGGEDHALAATFPPDVDLPMAWSVVGRVEAGEGVLVDGAAVGRPGRLAVVLSSAVLLAGAGVAAARAGPRAAGRRVGAAAPRTAAVRAAAPGRGLPVRLLPPVAGPAAPLAPRRRRRCSPAGGGAPTLELRVLPADGRRRRPRTRRRAGPARRPAARRPRGCCAATASRPPSYGCFGLHEWAMVYRLAADAGAPRAAAAAARQRRHRRGRRGAPLRCTHVDAYRFFTPRRRRATRSRPTRDEPAARSSSPAACTPGMDLYRWAAAVRPVRAGRAGRRLLRARPRDPRRRHAGLAVRPGRARLPADPRSRPPRGGPSTCATSATFAEPGAVLRQRLVAALDAGCSASWPRRRRRPAPRGDRPSDGACSGSSG